MTVKILTNQSKNKNRLVKAYGEPASVFTDYMDNDFDCWNISLQNESHVISALIEQGHLVQMLDTDEEPIPNMYRVTRDCKITDIIQETSQAVYSLLEKLAKENLSNPKSLFDPSITMETLTTQLIETLISLGFDEAKYGALKDLI